MKFILIPVILAIALLTPLLSAAEKSLNFTCDFMEKLGDAPWKVVDSRAYAAQLDSTFQFSMGNFSYRLIARQVRDTVVQIESQVNCLSIPSRNFFDTNILFQGASIFHDSALVRGNSVYRIRLVYDSIATTRNHCEYAFGDSSFKHDPSGDFDFHFVRGSLGDYHWNAIRDAFEKDYDGLIDRFHISDRTKTNFYICPCPLPDIGWDQRWGNGYDFARHNVFAHYGHGVNELHPEVVYMMRLMRVFGYAPAFLLEGAASSMEYCEVWTRDDYKNKRLPDITTWGETGKFRSVDREVSAHAAGSFVNYVFNTRGRDRLIEWFQNATDLTLNETFAKSYGQQMAEVVSEWHGYLDTLTLAAGPLSYFSSRAQMFLQYPRMLIYAEKAQAEGVDSIWSAQTLSSLYYTYGDFKRAGEALQPLLRDTTKAYQARIFYANMLLAMGEVDSARNIYESFGKTDSSLHTVYYKLGLIAFSKGEYPKALEALQKAQSMTRNPAFGVDYDLALGDIYAALKQTDSASVCYQRALDQSKLLVGAYSDNSLHHLRVGKAALRLKAPELAETELELALFLEERMFYVGQILLAKGELLDLKKDRKAAREQYQQILDMPTGYLEKQQARKYLKTPYKN